MNPQSIDTDAKSEQIVISLLRKKNIREKIALVRSLSRITIELSKRAIARANKGINDDQVNLLFIELHYGHELARRFSQYTGIKHDNS